MTVYDTALSKMVIENNLKDDHALTTFAKEDCSGSAPYFKATANETPTSPFSKCDTTQTTCAEGTHLATRAKLVSLYDSHQLKCQDGSTIFWTSEDYSPNIAYYFFVDESDINSQYDDERQVLCISA